ncbi:hypothetical protein APY04_0800 [Hyphomicrobium sulfonivorans]|uniref:Uncharacterized protein n=1 Tax=Hyphomicrobium sulfonivorans TaxID=121290 RepID=A0A125NVS6_HYPSL|nr:hypothetical protein [Hyphomicrobium sulfonivorans]KWT70739.1 hypothetical protein APY04_0800 [Hyphomicrobium sulfonivorans]
MLTISDAANEWKSASLCLGRAQDRIWLKPGAVQYLWVVRKLKDRWLVCLWSGDLVWLRLSGIEAAPDLDCGVPVIKWIGNGCLAQYYRFERPEVLQ